MIGWTLGGLPLHALRLAHPVSGTWTAEAHVASAVQPSGGVTLALPGWSRPGTVVSGGVSYQRQRVRVVGGTGGLSRQLPGQHFRLADVRTIAGWLCATAGESLSEASDPDVLARQLDHWQHQAGTAGQGLDQLARQLGVLWWMDDLGQVQLGQPAWTASDVKHDLLEEDLVNRVLLVVTTDAAILPGTAFRGRRVVSVQHQADGSRWRSWVRW